MISVKIRSTLTVFALTIFLVEIGLHILVHWNPKLLFPSVLRLVDSCEERECLIPNFHPVLGFNTIHEDPFGDGIRENTEGRPFSEVCAAAFGNSGTYSNDNSPENMWTERLSDLLECKVLNYGVGGYSYVQAGIKFSLYKPEVPIIILVINEEMMKRSLGSAAWWTISAIEKATLVPYADANGEVIPIPEAINTKTVNQHLQSDRLNLTPELRFPYILSIISYYGRGRFPVYYGAKPGHPSGHFNTFDDTFFTDDPYFGTLKKWINSFLANQQANSQKFVIAIYPSGDKLAERHEIIGRRFAELPSLPNVCYSNPAKYMAEKMPSNPDILGPTGHFNILGDMLFSEALFRDIQVCGFDIKK